VERTDPTKRHGITMSMSDRAIFPVRSHPGLRDARLRCKLSQDELAFLSGVPQPRLSRAERGYLWLRADERERVARVLGVGVTELDQAAERSSAGQP
jgi:transcriptional regulator with XRE-family HTH domain